MIYSKALKRAAAVVALAAVGTLGTAAMASAGAGITPENLVTADLLSEPVINHDRVKLQTKDATVVRVQRLTFGANSYSGWHHHPGVIVVSVRSGLVTLYDSTCGSKTYGPGHANGAVFVEGHDDAQEARSTLGAIVYVTYVVPASNPVLTRFRIEDDPPACTTAITFRNSPAGN